MHRRALLTSVGATTALSSGCLSAIENRLDPSVQLGWLAAHNYDTEPHRFELKVERDGTEVHYSSHEIESRDGSFINGAVAECDWGSESGDYVVFARIDERDWKEESVTEFATSRDGDVDCVIADAENRSDRLRFFLSSGCDRDYDGMCPFTNQ